MIIKNIPRYFAIQILSLSLFFSNFYIYSFYENDASFEYITKWFSSLLELARCQLLCKEYSHVVILLTQHLEKTNKQTNK